MTTILGKKVANEPWNYDNVIEYLRENPNNWMLDERHGELVIWTGLCMDKAGNLFVKDS